MIGEPAKIQYQQIRHFFKRDSEFLTLLPGLLHALNWDGSIRNLVENLPHFSETITLVEFRNTMSRLGYKSEQVKIELDTIPDSLFPVLYVPDYNKALIVVKRTNNGYVVITDESGIEHELYLTGYTGFAYFFKLEQETPVSQIQRSTWFYEHLLKYKYVFLQVLFISFLINFLLLITPIYIMNIYNRVIPTASVYMLFNFAIVGLSVLVAINLLQIVRIKILAYVSAKVDKAISAILMQTVLYLSSIYTENNSIGKQLARIKEFDTIRDFFASPLMVMTFETPFIVLFIFIIWLIGGPLAWIPVIMIGVFACLYYISIVYVDRANVTYFQINSAKQILQLETLTNMHDIKAMGQEELWLDRFRDSSASATFASYKASSLAATMDIISETLMMIGGLLILVFGTNAAIKNELSLGGLMAIMMLTWKTLSPLKAFFAALPKLQQLITSIKQINALFSVATEKTTKKEIKKVNWHEVRVTFSRISFRYRPELTPALLGINFDIKPNEFVCLVGPSGSGKSTILKMLLELYTPQAGNIYINGMNINQIDFFELRNFIAYLPQRSDLFYGTIMQNILFSDLAADRYRIEVASRLAGVYDEIMALPEQFNSRVGDQASNLYSASFLKRICLARTLLKNSNLLLLDEPESSLDEKSAGNLAEVISYFYGKKTIILATHRPSYMRKADRILYFKEGQLILDNTPKEVFKTVSINEL